MYYMYKDRHEKDKCELLEDEDLRKKKGQEEREVPGAAGSALLLQLDGE